MQEQKSRKYNSKINSISSSLPFSCIPGWFRNGIAKGVNIFLSLSEWISWVIVVPLALNYETHDQNVPAVRLQLLWWASWSSISALMNSFDLDLITHFAKWLLIQNDICLTIIFMLGSRSLTSFGVVLSDSVQMTTYRIWESLVISRIIGSDPSLSFC